MLKLEAQKLLVDGTPSTEMNSPRKYNIKAFDLCNNIKGVPTKTYTH